MSGILNMLLSRSGGAALSAPVYLGASEAPTISGSNFTVTGASIGSGYTHIAVGSYGAFSPGRTWVGCTVDGDPHSTIVTAPSAQGVAGIAIVPHPGVSTADIVMDASGTGGLRGGLIWWGLNITSSTPLASATDNVATTNAVDTGSQAVSGPLVWVAITGVNSVTSLTVTWSQGTEDRDVTYSGGRTISGASALDANGLSSETISATYSGATTLPSLAWVALS